MEISDIIFIQTSGNNQTDYSYDNRGNLYLKTTKTYTATGTESTDVTSMGESTLYEYDGFNRLTDVTNGGNKADYEYNTSGLRTSKTVNGERTDFILDGVNVIAEIKDGDVTNYVRGLTGIIYRKTKDGTKTYYVKNIHGDVTKLVNSSGVVIKSYNYNEFGIESNVDKTDTNPFRYCGEYYDNETGLIYLRARYYDVTIGRFISEDPAMDDNNWYVYCNCNPINFFDPNGLYDRDKAVEFALQYADLNNKATWAYPIRFENDCAHFVTECLWRGGFQQNDDWYCWGYATIGTRVLSGPSSYSATWTCAEDQFNWISNPKNNYINGNVVCIHETKWIKDSIKNYNIQKGDIIYWDFYGKGHVSHASIVVSVENGEITYAQHSDDNNKGDVEQKLNELDAKGYDVYVYIVRIKDDAK